MRRHWRNRTYTTLIRGNKTSDDESKLNWDVIGIASAALTLVGAALFYITGWVYEVHWYGFFRMSISQLRLDSPQIIVYGVPGIFIPIISYSSILLIALFTHYVHRDFRINRNLIIRTLLITLYILVILQLIVSWMLRVISWELILTAFGSIGLLILATSFYIPILIFLFFASIPVPVTYLLIRLKFGWKLIINHHFKYLYLIIHPSHQKFALKMKDLFKSESSDATKKFSDILSLYINMDHDFFKVPEEYTSQFSPFPMYNFLVRKTIQNARGFDQTGKFGYIAILLIFFLLSISTSAIVGEFDARRGTRLMDGNWRLSEAYISSTSEIQILEDDLIKVESNYFVYGPLCLIANEESAIYLVECKNKPVYFDKPALYVIPKDIKENVQLFIPSEDRE